MSPRLADGPSRGLAIAAASTPATRFSFWSSMGDLVRLVMRSKAEGL